jgi:hypothetical protein
MEESTDRHEREEWQDWCRAAARRQTLTEWACKTLGMPDVLPCVCTEGTCLRCRTSLAVLDETGG